MTGSRDEQMTRRGTLTRELIIAEAIAAIDDDGLDRLTMRALGARLGVEAMALYRYVDGREDLLEGVVGTLVGNIVVEPHEESPPTAGWHGFLASLAHSVRHVATDHPAIFPLIATRHPAAPWLRPPLRSLRIVDGFLSGLTDHGFSDRQAVDAYRMFTGFLLGYLLLEVAASGASTVPGEPIDEGDGSSRSPEAVSDVADYPSLSRMADMLTEFDADAEFEIALETLLDRIERHLAV